MTRRIFSLLVAVIFIAALPLSVSAQWGSNAISTTLDITTATVDTLKATNSSVTGYSIIDGTAIVRDGLTVTGITASDTLNATNSAVTGYSIVNGASIIRGGQTVTGSASADTTKGTNAAFTGYGIVNGATILRGTATVAGLLTPQAFSNPVQLLLADSTLTAARSGYTYIARPLAAKATVTLPTNPAVGTNFIFFVADADSLLITAAGSDSLIDGTGAAWKTTSSVAGWIKAVLSAANKWFFIQYNGTWTSY